MVVGLGSMIGAGVFAAFGPAAEVAGNALVLGLLLAALIAYFNATSSAELAAVYPQAGGAYVYGRERLRQFWGFVGRLAWLSPVVRFGAAVASLGVSRTTFAMASNRNLPEFLSAVHPRHRVPHRADLAVGALTAVLAATLDVHIAIGVSSFAVLVYYAIANASAWTLEPEKRLWPRPLAALGFCGCLTISFTLPVTAVAAGATLLLLGAVVHRAVSSRRRIRPDEQGPLPSPPT